MRNTNRLGLASILLAGATAFIPTFASAAEPSPAHSKPQVVVLDPGHGMGSSKSGVYDPGKVVGNYKEAEIALGISYRVGQILAQRGYAVYLTREDQERETPLSTRDDYASNKNADAFVSIHLNSTSSPESRGALTCYNPDGRDGKICATVVQTVLDETLSRHIQGYQPKKYNLQERKSGKNGLAVLQQKNIPSILIETGFLSNACDRQYLINHPDVVAQGIADGITRYLEGNRAGVTSTPSLDNAVVQPVSPAVEPSAGTYVVQPGDAGFWGISRKLGISPRELQEMNPNVDAKKLAVGQRLTYSAAANSSAPTTSSTYTIKPGDSFYAIGRALGISPKDLQEQNPTLNPKNLKVGQILTYSTGKS